ncbi:MAG TPA: hypothetical protein VMW91_09660 [Desulfosporosinus sp.]|nr:hypothetical protein [Desulfosporosinus sp.]
MGKQQKPKPPSLGKTNRNHNRATKGNNTRKKGALWSIRKAIVRNKKTGDTREVDVEIRVPYDAQYDPFINIRKEMPEPYDSLSLDWADETLAYITENNAKLYKELLPCGKFEYKVRDESGNLIFSVISERNAFMEPRPRRKRRRGRQK